MTPYIRYGAYASLAVLLLALMLAAWSFTLRRRVIAKTAELSRSLDELSLAKQAVERAIAALDITDEINHGPILLRLPASPPSVAARWRRRAWDVRRCC